MNLIKLLKSKRLWFAIAIIIGLLYIRINPILVFTAIFTLAIIYDNNTIRPLKNYKFWIVIMLLVIVVPLFTGIQDKSILGIKYSSVQLQKTLLMTLRGISVFLLFQVLTTNLVVEDIKPIFKKLGLNNFDILYNLSNEIFPKIKSILLARYGLFKQNWKSIKSLDTIINFITDIFYDFFALIDQLGTNQKEDYLSPEELISNIDGNNNLIIISGDAGTGKTTWIEQFIELSKKNNLATDGLYSKKVIEANDLWHHELIRISSNESHRLNTMEQINTDVKIGKFFFYPKTLEWGNSQLNSIKKVDWIIIDEIGLLEFNCEGLLPGFQKIAPQNGSNIIITIRSSLINNLDEFLSEYVPVLCNRKKIVIEL